MGMPFTSSVVWTVEMTFTITTSFSMGTGTKSMLKGSYWMWSYG